jgi:CheY-like chemotaxis protein
MSQRASLMGQRILVVDDDADTLFLLTLILEEGGAGVNTANSVAEAIILFKELHPTLLISDLGFPFEDGYSLIRELRTLETSLGWQVPAIALTGYADKESRQRALELPNEANPARYPATSGRPASKRVGTDINCEGNKLVGKSPYRQKFHLLQG